MTSSKRSFIRLAEGCTRLVLLIGPVAIKLPHFGKGWRMGLTGMLSNMTEARFSRLSRSSRLCPILFSVSGGFLVVMRRAQPLTSLEFEEAKSLGWLDDERFFHTEMKRCSYGWLDGRIVSVDYGEAYLGAGTAPLPVSEAENAA